MSIVNTLHALEENAQKHTWGQLIFGTTSQSKAWFFLWYNNLQKKFQLKIDSSNSTGALAWELSGLHSAMT